MSNLFFYFKQFLLKIKSYLPENDNLDWLDGFAFIMSAWLLMYPYPSYAGLFCVLAFIPILGITLTIIKGNAGSNSYLDKVYGKNEDDQNTVPLYIILPSFILAIRIFIKFDCENYCNLLTHGGIVFLIFGVLFLLPHRNIKGSLKQRTQFYGLLGACILFYSYGATFGINCLFDKSLPERFETRITTKYTRGGGDYPPVLYHVTVAPWENHSYKENLQISEKEYEIADNGDYMYILSLIHI